MFYGWIKPRCESARIAVALWNAGITLGGWDGEMWEYCLVPNEAITKLPVDLCSWFIAALPEQLGPKVKELWPRGQRLWIEDEALLHLDGERIETAWQRLFGEALPEYRLCLHYDGGDTDWYRAPNGCTFYSSYDGHAIYDVVK